MAAACHRVTQSGRPVLMLANLSRTGAISPEVRKMMTNEMNGARLGAVAIVGASFAVRVISTLAAKSLQILTANSYPVEFFATEAEARAWLLAQGAKILAMRPPGA